MYRLSAAALSLAVLATSVCSGPALAERRVALLVGNSTYQNATTLANPSNDAQAVAGKLKDAGFDVISAHNDLGNLQFKRVIRQFEDAAHEADIVVVFYAGHGIEIRGVNYLIPVDATLASDRDADDEAITLDRLLQSVEGAKRLGVVILDACRDNPFAKTMKRARTAALRAGVTPGLAIVEPASRNTLIAYAAKSGTAAEDGIGRHSPFTTALLNNLFVPGLDVRLAFGRVRDEVLKNTRNRQEPFVSGSLGGAHLSLVPPPPQPVVAAAAAPDETGQKNDYALVERIGTQRAWEVFLNQHPKGFYADLARQHIAKLIEPGDAPAAGRKVDEPVVASLTPSKPPSPPGASSEEQRAWDRIKDTSNSAAFRDFIKRYPSSVLSNTAQTRLEALERAAQEQEDKARAEREAKAAEAARQRTEREAAFKRAEEERQAKAAEAARQKAERDAALKQAEDERKAKAAEAAKRAEEERLARLSDSERQKAEREAAFRKAEEERRAKAEEERQAKAAEAARQKAEREAALRQADEERKAKAAEAARQKTEREAALKQAEDERKAKGVEAAKHAENERQAKLGAAARARQERQDGACQREADLLATLKAAAGNQAWAREDLKRLEQSLACERLRPEVVAALDKGVSEPDRKAPAAVEPPTPAANTPELVSSAQKELARIGCFAGAIDGNLNTTTQAAVRQYQAQRGHKASGPEITDRFVAELKDRRTRVCPLVCPAGKVVEGETCVAAKKPTPVARQRDKADDDAEEEKPRRRQRAKAPADTEDEKPRRQQRAKAPADAEDEKPRRQQRAKQQEARPQPAAARPQPRVRQEAISAPAPRYSGGGGGGGGRPIIGVGF